MAKRVYNDRVQVPEYNTMSLRQDASAYLKAHFFLTDLRKRYMRREITGEQYSSLRRKALQGNLDGAGQELEVLLYEVGQ